MISDVDINFDNYASLFKTFTVARYKIIIQADEAMELPRFKGSMLRGGFGHAFRKICCMTDDRTCDRCKISSDCVYAGVFNASPDQSAQHMVSHIAIPRPYVIEPPLDDKTTYKPGDKIVFHLVLVGRAIENLSYFVFAFNELCKTGITKKRYGLTLHSIQSVNCLTGELASVYNATDKMVVMRKDVLQGSQLLGNDSEVLQEIVLRFLAPTRIKYAGKYYFDELPFVALIQNLTLRINALSHFHCGGAWSESLKDLREIAKTVATDSKVSRTRVLRYSSRQKQLDSLSGFTGDVKYTGDLQIFLPILRLGQQIHVGNDATFGCGKYELLDFAGKNAVVDSFV